jgi:dethiobiotin synthetase
VRPRAVRAHAVRTLVVTGTGTGVGKTVVTAAIAALARERGVDVAVVKPAQTGVLPGQSGDLDQVARLSGVSDLHEFARFPAALSPEAAARVSGLPPADLRLAARQVTKLAADGKLVLIEGAGGVAVRYDPAGTTVADLASALGAPVLVVTCAGLGTLNHTALTLMALSARGLECAGVVVGNWPAEPDIAARCNLADLRVLAGRPLGGAVQANAGSLDPQRFRYVARACLAPALGGEFDPAEFEWRHGWQ